MASQLSLTITILIVLLAVATATQHETNHALNVGKITSALSSKGYRAMSLILEQTLPTLLEASHGATGFTVFCPPDKAFFSLKYPQPPFTLLQYHIVPTKLDKAAFESSSSVQFESKVDTLLAGHPLVVTALSKSRHGASLNDVKVTEWEIYNDGLLVVHGVEGFFDPSLQVLRYPWYDGMVAKTNDENRSTSDADSMDHYWAKYTILEIVATVFLLVLLVSAVAYTVYNICCYYLFPGVSGYDSVCSTDNNSSITINNSSKTTTRKYIFGD